MAKLVLIGTQGSLRTRQDEIYRLLKSSALSRQEYLIYAAKNMGEIVCKVTGTRIHVSLRLSSVTDKSSIQLYYLLSDHAELETHLTLYVGDGHEGLIEEHYRFDTGAKALSFLSKRIDECSERHNGRLHKRKRPLASLANAHVFRDLIGFVNFIDPFESRELLRACLARRFQNRYLLLRCATPSIDEARLVLEDAGRGYCALGLQTLQGHIGKPFMTAFSDAEYYAFVKESYVQSFQSNEPLIEELDATVTTPDGVTMFLIYERLIVPLADPWCGLPTCLSVTRAVMNPIVISSSRPT